MFDDFLFKVAEFDVIQLPKWHINDLRPLLTTPALRLHRLEQLVFRNMYCLLISAVVIGMVEVFGLPHVHAQEVKVFAALSYIGGDVGTDVQNSAPEAKKRVQEFKHPGGLHDQGDLDRMKAKVEAGEHPWVDDWHKLLLDPLAQYTYEPGAQPSMESRQRASKDAHAAYLNALRWFVSGDVRHADCAIRICNAWSTKVDQMPTGADIPGLSGIPIAEFALAGELLRICPRWQVEDFSRFKGMLLTFWYPVVHDFLARHNGQDDTYYWANWDIANVGALLAIGVLCDRRDIFDEGVAYFKNGKGNGSIEHAVYFLHPGGLGQWQESGRDQPHAELGVGLMAQLCEVAWKQGVDLYGYADNRLLAGAEYVAQWDLWKPVPYQAYTNSAHANQRWLSINGRGRLNRPIWELLYNHYVVRRGLRAPNTTAMAHLLRLEGGSVDHFGYGTLTFTLNAERSPYPPSPVPPVPTGLSAAAGAGQVFLNWARSGDIAQGYEVRRGTHQEGPFERIASWADNTCCEYTDATVEPGITYFYVVAALNQAGSSGDSPSASATSVSLKEAPPEWSAVNIGSAGGAETSFAEAAGGTFRVRGSGGGIGGASDSMCFVERNVVGDATVTARLAEAQWEGVGKSAKLGVMMRASAAADAPTLMMKLGDLGNRQAGFGARVSTGGQMTWVGGNDYTWLPAWFRLERKRNTFNAFESSDGVHWFQVGTCEVAMENKYLVGLAISPDCDQPKNALFDHVSVDGGR